MSDKKRRITVCVLALVDGEQGSVLPDELRNQLYDQEDYDVTNQGCVYSTSRDDWAPFVDQNKILIHIKENGYRVTPSSSYLSRIVDQKMLQELFEKTDLYVIDPAFLTLEKFASFLHELHGAIRGNSKKYYCVIIPEQIPDPPRTRLTELCEEKLPGLPLIRLRRLGWKIESKTRLQGFLDSLHVFLADDLTWNKTGTRDLGNMPHPGLGRGG